MNMRVYMRNKKKMPATMGEMMETQAWMSARETGSTKLDVTPGGGGFAGRISSSRAMRRIIGVAGMLEEMDESARESYSSRGVVRRTAGLKLEISSSRIRRTNHQSRDERPGGKTSGASGDRDGVHILMVLGALRYPTRSHPKGGTPPRHLPA